MRATIALLSLLLCATMLFANTIYLSAPGALYAVDPAQPAATFLGPSGTWFDIALSPAGVLYASDSYRLFRVDPASGASTLIGPMEAFINGMTFVGSTLYASGGESLYTIDPESGKAYLVGSTGFFSSGDLEFFAGTLYLTAGLNWSTDALVRLDPLTGQGTLIGPIGFSQVYGLAAASGGLFGFTSTGFVLSLDPATGAGTNLGWATVPANGAAASPAVPEPSALCMLGSGLLLLARRLRRP